MKLFLLAAALAGAVWAAGWPEVEPLPFDSAARAVGEVARALGGGGQGLLEPYPQLAAPFLRLLRHLPRGWRLAVVRWGMSFSLGYPSTAFSSWDPEEPFAHYVARYPPRTYDAVVLGSPSGGTAHLAALLGAPLLPPCYLLGARHRIDSDDMDAYISTARAALQGMERDEGVEAIVHYDPLHDRDLVANAALFRIRALDLPEAYREFIERHLRPGGTIVIAEDTYAWPQTALNDGIWLQLGGLGDVPPEEYLRRYPPAGEPVRRRESEWGTPEALLSAAEGFARENGFRVLRVAFPHPDRFSTLAYRAYRAAGARDAGAPRGVFQVPRHGGQIDRGGPASAVVGAPPGQSLKIVRARPGCEGAASGAGAEIKHPHSAGGAIHHSGWIGR